MALSPIASAAAPVRVLAPAASQTPTTVAAIEQPSVHSFVEIDLVDSILSGRNDRWYPQPVRSVSAAAAATPSQATDATVDTAAPRLHQPLGIEADELTLSSEALAADQAPAPNALRAARLDSIKAAIDAGTYDIDAKLDLAIDRLLDDLA